MTSLGEEHKEQNPKDHTERTGRGWVEAARGNSDMRLDARKGF